MQENPHILNTGNDPNSCVFKGTICNISALKCLKTTYVIYLYELCSYTIPNVSTKCQTQRNLLFYFQTRHVSFSRPSVASYNLSPSSYSNFRQNTGTKMIRSGVIVNHAMSQKKNTCNRNTAFFLPHSIIL